MTVPLGELQFYLYFSSGRNTVSSQWKTVHFFSKISDKYLTNIWAVCRGCANTIVVQAVSCEQENLFEYQSLFCVSHQNIHGSRSRSTFYTVQICVSCCLSHRNIQMSVTQTPRYPNSTKHLWAVAGTLFLPVQSSVNHCRPTAVNCSTASGPSTNKRHAQWYIVIHTVCWACAQEVLAVVVSENTNESPWWDLGKLRYHWRPLVRGSVCLLA